MNGHRMGRRSRTPLATAAGLLVAVVASGCTSWYQAYPESSMSPVDVIQVWAPDRVRILRQRGAELELHEPTVSGDSIVGEVRRFGSGRVAVPLSDVRRLDVRDGNALKTGILAVPLSFIALIFLFPF